MECMHCVHIIARSTHILQVHTERLERCYTNEGAALTQCPTEEHIAEKTAVELMLYSKCCHQIISVSLVSKECNIVWVNVISSPLGRLQTLKLLFIDFGSFKVSLNLYFERYLLCLRLTVPILAHLLGLCPHWYSVYKRRVNSLSFFF